MHTIPTSNVPPTDVEALESFAGEVGPELRDVIVSLSRGIRDGAEVAILKGNETVTPSQAAQYIGLSRTFLYKMLDRGEIASHRVGRDRRIAVSDLLAFEARRRQDRDELAERFASQEQTRRGAIDEIADLL